MTDLSSPSKDGSENENSERTSEAQPNVIRVHGKEFDVNDPIQKAQLAAWDEAHAKFVGRQSNELGQLRKFYEERKPTADESELLAKAKMKAAEGDFDSAFDMVFSTAKAKISAVEERLEKTKANSSLWEEYFSERPELAKRFGREKVKQISETTLNLYDADKDAFATLDAYWKPFYEMPSGTRATNTEKPPVTVTGSPTSTAGRPASAVSSKAGKPNEKPKVSAFDALEAYTIGARKV